MYYNDPMYKLIVFIPKPSLDKVRQAIFEAGGGEIGNYDSCSFVSEGVGTFRPRKGAKPFVGKIGKMEKVTECRLEVVVPQSKIKKVIRSMKAAHPYEEPAFDVLELKA